jgi:aminomethyltransferase
MPVQSSGIVEEHGAVRSRAGLFDLCHMGRVRVRGRNRRAFLQKLLTIDVDKVPAGRCRYSFFLNEKGTVIDDLVFYAGTEDDLLVINASNREKDLAWMEKHRPEGAEIEDQTFATALLAVQGPESLAAVRKSLGIDPGALGYYTWGMFGGRLVSRTGYTGEDGFEIFVAPSTAPGLWRRIIEAGAPFGLLPAGLGARDTLRLEARMMLYGNDIDETTTLIEAGLGWIVSTHEAKGDFNGRAILAEQKAKGAPRKLVGFEMTEPGIPRHGYPVALDGEVVGAVTSGTFAPFLRKSIGLCYLPTPRAAVGTEIAVEIRGRRTAARVVPTPFYKRPR